LLWGTGEEQKKRVWDPQEGKGINNDGVEETTWGLIHLTASVHAHVGDECEVARFLWLLGWALISGLGERWLGPTGKRLG
jgi:hypothetical protein